MKYCPECRSEYEERVKSCTDCGSILITEEEWKETLRKESEEIQRLGEMIQLMVVESQFQKDDIVDALTKEGIPHFVREFHDTAFDGLYTKQLGWGEIEVPKADFERAKEIAGKVLEDLEEEETEIEGDSES